jgi:hypothetical protein
MLGKLYPGKKKKSTLGYYAQVKGQTSRGRAKAVKSD